jgi:hypothetical protein
MTEEEEDLIDQLMSAEFRKRENGRKTRRLRRTSNRANRAVAMKTLALVKSIR